MPNIVDITGDRNASTQLGGHVQELQRLVDTSGKFCDGEGHQFLPKVALHFARQIGFSELLSRHRHNKLLMHRSFKPLVDAAGAAVWLAAPVLAHRCESSPKGIVTLEML